MLCYAVIQASSRRKKRILPFAVLMFPSPYTRPRRFSPVAGLTEGTDCEGRHYGYGSKRPCRRFRTGVINSRTKSDGGLVEAAVCGLSTKPGGWSKLHMPVNESSCASLSGQSRRIFDGLVIANRSRPAQRQVPHGTESLPPFFQASKEVGALN